MSKFDYRAKMASMAKTTTKTYTYSSSGGGKGNTDVTIEYSQDLSSLSRLQDKIRLLQEDMESEREIRQRIEREKADLSVQVIQLQERLEEAECGVEGQFEINKKRDAELAKLRRLLEDVHLESEETAAILRKKHQEAILDYQDQLDQLAKAKAKSEKEKSKLQSEIFELMSQIESINKDKLLSVKTVEKLEIHVHELTVKIEELNRTIIDITSVKQRISTENITLTKEVQELKVSIENITYLRSQLATQLDDSRRRLEEEDRRRSTLESQLHSVEIELESCRVQLEEESESRLEVERQLSKSNADVTLWRSKYETEVSSRAEELEEVRRKFHIRISEQEEQIESLLAKVTALEKQKSRLQSEVEVLIIDLEKANGTARELQKRCDQLDRLNADLKSKLDELNGLYEASQRDNRNKQTQIQQLTHELDKTREAKEYLARENKKISDDLHETKNSLSEVSRRYHELELDYRRLENEREELSAAYKEAEAARKIEEQRAQRLTAELTQIRHEFERRLQEKEEEVEAIRKQTTIEIEQLNARLVEAETRLKTEVLRIKKKLQIQITELEMSLDVANKSNIELQKTIKKYSITITEITAQYEEVQRQLQIALDQYGQAQRRAQALQAELDEVRSSLEAASRARRCVEQALDESQSRVNELTTININLASIKTKIEQELSILSSDYDEVSKELKLSDERYQKVQSELVRTVDILHEEQERIVKIETIKKTLEIEVKNLTVRLEEVEANALVNGKRIISKLEGRLRDLELECDEEKRRHSETVKILRKKERTVKEVMITIEDQNQNIALLQEALDKVGHKANLYKRQLQEQESLSATSVTRVRRFQRELEAAEDRADSAESNLSLIRAKHRSFVTSSSTPGQAGQVYLVQETRTTTSENY